VSIFDVYKNGKPVLEGVNAGIVADKFNTTYQEVYACARYEKLLNGIYQVCEHEINKCPDLSFVRKFGWKAFKEWTAMNRRYGTNR